MLHNKTLKTNWGKTTFPPPKKENNIPYLIVSVGSEFSEGIAGMSALCSAMSEASDQRLKDRRAGIFENWRIYFLVGSQMVTRWYGRAGSSMGCMSILMT